MESAMSRSEDFGKRAIWTDEETRALLAIINERNVLDKIDGRSQRNKKIYESMEKEFANRGIYRTWEQIRAKWKNMKKTYKKIKTNMNVSGAANEGQTWPYFEEVDNLLGQRPTAVAMASGGVDSMHSDTESQESQLQGGSQIESSSEAGSSNSVETQEPDSDDGSSIQTQSQETSQPPRRKRRKTDMDEFVKIYEENCEKDREMMREIMGTLSRDFSAGIDRIIASTQVQFDVVDISEQ